MLIIARQFQKSTVATIMVWKQVLLNNSSNNETKGLLLASSGRLGSSAIVQSMSLASSCAIPKSHSRIRQRRRGQRCNLMLGGEGSWRIGRQAIEAVKDKNQTLL